MLFGAAGRGGCAAGHTGSGDPYARRGALRREIDGQGRARDEGRGPRRARVRRSTRCATTWVEVLRELHVLRDRLTRVEPSGEDRAAASREAMSDVDALRDR